MKNTTLLFLVKRTGRDISEICLAMKKRGFGMGRWNGVGGKVSDSESVENAAKRETLEEVGVEVENLKKVAELSFSFPHKPEWDQLVFVFITESWKGEPSESEEMKPRWYKIDSLPFESMWPDDIFWLPRVIDGELIRASFSFGEGDVILEKDIQKVIAL
ncbi:MAG: 8-oxo-dGTP diphosphatase [Patescibacteria group bacterium]